MSHLASRNSGDGSLSYYDEDINQMNLNDSEKAYFDSLVREEMEKLEREFRRSMADIGGTDSHHEPPVGYSAPNRSPRDMRHIPSGYFRL